MASALDGIRVIDFGQYIAGPLTGMLLADQGADVVKVDPPGGPIWDTPANATWNRGKRSILLDLKRAEDLKIAKELSRRADVVVENFRPGVMDRLGLGAEVLMADNPALIYCSMPGFASDDPRASIASWEGVVAAAAGTYRPSPTGSDPDRPVYTAIPIASCYAAFLSAVSITMGLIARVRDGIGQRIEVPLFDAMFVAMGARALTTHDRPAATPVPTVGTWTRQYQCKDGRWVQYHAGNLNFRAFLDAVGATSWDVEELSSEEQQQRVTELFRSRTALEWEDMVEALGSECSVCRTSAEWLQHPHALASGMVVEVEDPGLGKMLQPGINARMSATPGSIRSPAPQPDADRTEILTELKSTAPRSIRPISSDELRSALHGAKVLDLCIILAGPTCGRTLAEFGADVIKIDSPYRERVAFHNEINRAKRSILLDLKTKEGLDVFWCLLEDADVVVQNFRKGVAERLGIGYEDVRQRKPDVVYASLNTYGQEGPWAGRPGHEQIAQAATGMQERYGGAGRPTLAPYAINDYGTGLMGAYGVALALFHRQLTGEGQHVDTALAYTACTLQSPFLQDYIGKAWTEPRGQDTLGSGPLDRAYKAEDGWLFISARQADVPALAHAVGLEAIAGLSGAELEQAVEDRLPNASVTYWVEHLNAAGIGAHRVISDLQELMTDSWVINHGLSVTREHDGLGRITTPGPAPRLSRTPVRVGRPAPRPGANAREIINEIGLGDRFDDLVENGVIRLDGVVAG